MGDIFSQMGYSPQISAAANPFSQFFAYKKENIANQTAQTNLNSLAALNDARINEIKQHSNMMAQNAMQTQLGLPYIGPQALANLGVTNAQRGLYGAQTGLANANTGLIGANTNAALLGMAIKKLALNKLFGNNNGVGGLGALSPNASSNGAPLSSYLKSNNIGSSSGNGNVYKNMDTLPIGTAPDSSNEIPEMPEGNDALTNSSDSQMQTQNMVPPDQTNIEQASNQQSPISDSDLLEQQRQQIADAAKQTQLLSLAGIPGADMGLKIAQSGTPQQQLAKSNLSNIQSNMAKINSAQISKVNDAGMAAYEMKPILQSFNSVLDKIPKAEFTPGIRSYIGIGDPNFKELQNLNAQLMPLMAHMRSIPARAWTNQEMSILGSGIADPRQTIGSLKMNLNLLKQMVDRTQVNQDKMNEYYQKNGTLVGYKPYMGTAKIKLPNGKLATIPRQNLEAAQAAAANNGEKIDEVLE